MAKEDFEPQLQNTKSVMNIYRLIVFNLFDSNSKTILRCGMDPRFSPSPSSLIASYLSFLICQVGQSLVMKHIVQAY